MKIEELESILKEIREREDFLVSLKKKDVLNVSYWGHNGAPMSGHERRIFTLSEEENKFLLKSSVDIINSLRSKTIELIE